MELHIQSDFDCVYSVNGEFFERATSVSMSEYDVVYVTVFPLGNLLLPYTVKFCGTENIKTELACGVRLSPEHYILTLSPRHMTVYGSRQKALLPKSNIARLFAFVKSGDTTSAYAMLTDELKSHIGKSELSEFFKNYEHLIECDWEHGNKFYLININGMSKLHTYTLKNEFIDDITECD